MTPDRLSEELAAAIDEADRNEGTEIPYEEIGAYVMQVYREAIAELQANPDDDETNAENQPAKSPSPPRHPRHHS